MKTKKEKKISMEALRYLSMNDLTGGHDLPIHSAFQQIPSEHLLCARCKCPFKSYWKRRQRKNIYSFLSVIWIFMINFFQNIIANQKYFKIPK